MYKLSLIVALCLGIPLVHGEGYIVGDVKWNSSGKALSEDQIRETYTIGEEKKSAGAFSSYIKGTLKSNGEKVGMKLEDPKETECYLPLEVQVYEDLEKKASMGNLLEKGFANLYGYGLLKKKRVLMISQFGSDLIGDLDNKNIFFYEWDDLRLVATCAIEEIQFLHQTGYVHNDLKPDNFMYGLEDPKKVDPKKNPRASFKNRVYMIDFGGASKYQDAKGTHYKQTEAPLYTITTGPYYPRTFFNNLTRSRRDDMESLGYTLLLVGGVIVPWNDLNETDAKNIVEEQNRLCDKLEVVPICRESEIIDKRVQAAFSTYFYLLKKLFTDKNGFSSEPDYAAFKKCFGDDPQAHYLKVTGKKFDESAAGKLFRRAAKRFSSHIKAEPKKANENPPKSPEQQKKKKK